MGRLDETGMGIGDFAMSLMDSGKISKKVQSPEIARPKELPETELDISEVQVTDSMVDKVLNESFGLSNTPTRRQVNAPVLTEQELLQEKITSLRSELVETVNKLTSLVSEAAQMVENFTGTGAGLLSMAGGKNGHPKGPRAITRKRRHSK